METLYNYMAMETLKDNLDDDINNYLTTHLCIYTVNTNGKYPFLQYLLANNGFNELSLPLLPSFSKLKKDDLISYSKVYLSGILQADNFEKFTNSILFKGFYEFNGKLYVFFDASKCELNLDDIYIYSPFRFALLDEIVNKKNVCNIIINYETTKFFTSNDSLCYLYDENNKPYENPIVGYVGKSTPEKLNFTFTFGESAKNKCALFGPYYYFTNFSNAIRQGGWSHNYKPEQSYGKYITDNDNGRYSKGGIVRFALFTGKTKYIENLPNDPIDESEIRKELIKDSNAHEIQLLRISDHDGLWSNLFDSIYLANIELDDGSYIEDSPKLVLKEYSQQVPLSYHFIDKYKLGSRFNVNNNQYSIV